MCSRGAEEVLKGAKDSPESEEDVLEHAKCSASRKKIEAGSEKEIYRTTNNEMKLI